jgi:hypothetical protein
MSRHMSTTPIAKDNADTTFDSAPLVGNPQRVRGLDSAMLDRPAPVSELVGNPRRLRKLDPAAFAA